MKAYWAFFRTRFRVLIQYRTAAIAGICTQWLFGMVYVLTLYAFYQNGDAEQPMTFAQSASYIWLGQAMLGMLPWSGETEIMQSVRTGQVAYELTRPLSLYAMWFARSIAFRVAPTILRAVPQFLISLFLIPAPFGMLMPSLGQWLGWFAATFGALMLSCAIMNLMHVSLFWTTSGEGISRLLPSAIMILSGMILPLKLWPDAIQTLLRYQPFEGLVDGPAQIFCGSMALSELPALLATQLGWALVLILLGWALIKRAARRVQVAGG